MFSEVLTALSPILGLCHNTPHLAETLLLILISFFIGFCCGGLVVALLISAHCRGAAARLICYLLEGADRDWRPRLEAARPPDRLQRYRA